MSVMARYFWVCLGAAGLIGARHFVLWVWLAALLEGRGGGRRGRGGIKAERVCWLVLPVEEEILPLWTGGWVAHPLGLGRRGQVLKKKMREVTHHAKCGKPRTAMVATPGNHPQQHRTQAVPPTPRKMSEGATTLHPQTRTHTTE